MDDGSTDTTPELVRGVDGRPRSLSAASHMGIARVSTPACERRARRSWPIQDADDWSESEPSRAPAGLLDSRPDVAVVGCRMHEVDEDGRPLAPRTSFAAGDVEPVLMRFNPIPNSCACLRRDAVLAVGGYDPRYLYATD